VWVRITPIASPVPCYSLLDRIVLVINYPASFNHLKHHAFADTVRYPGAVKDSENSDGQVAGCACLG